MGNIIRNIKINSDTCWKLTVLFCLSGLLFTMPDAASASSSNTAISNALCLIANELTGKIGKGIATVGVVMLGIGLFLGKLSWGLAVAVGIGIAGIFGATTIVNWMSGGASSTGCAGA